MLRKLRFASFLWYVCESILHLLLSLYRREIKRSAAVIILLTFFVHAHSTELGHSREAQISVEKLFNTLVDKLANKLFARGLRWPRWFRHSQTPLTLRRHSSFVSSSKSITNHDTTTIGKLGNRAIHPCMSPFCRGGHERRALHEHRAVVWAFSDDALSQSSRWSQRQRSFMQNHLSDPGDLTQAAQGALQVLASRLPHAALLVDMSTSWAEIEKELRVAAAKADSVSVLLGNMNFSGADDAAEILVRCYTALQDGAAEKGLVLNAEVLPCLEHAPSIAAESLLGRPPVFTRSAMGDLRPCGFSGPLFSHVILGGTFDHLHAGHRVLVSVAGILSNSSLTIGVSGAPLLVTKATAEELEPWEHRRDAVVAFAKKVRPSLQVHSEELLDPFGPSANPEYEVLVVSDETKKAGEAVSNLRNELGVRPFAKIVSVPLVPAPGAKRDDHVKASSTELREVASVRKSFLRCWESAKTVMRTESTTNSSRLGEVLYMLYAATVHRQPSRSPHRLRRSWLRRLWLDFFASSSDPVEALALCVVAAAPGLRQHLQAKESIVAATAPETSYLLKAAEVLLDALAAEVALVPDVVDKTRALLPWVSRPRIIGLVMASDKNPLGREANEVLEQHGAHFVHRDHIASLAAPKSFVFVEGSCADAETWMSQCDEVWAVGHEAFEKISADVEITGTDAASIRSTWEARLPKPPDRK